LTRIAAIRNSTVSRPILIAHFTITLCGLILLFAAPASQSVILLPGDQFLVRAIFSQTLSQFDGVGFHDLAYDEYYETYKLALALFSRKVMSVPIPGGDHLLGLLLAMQGEDGGFISYYLDAQTPIGDANTETTALALLALHSYGCIGGSR
jgi:hypothetical protein